MANELMINTLIEKLKEQELLLADFYEMLIERLPKHEKMWTYLAEQERMHAKALEMLKAKFADKTVYLNSKQISFKTINYSIEFIMTNKNDISNQKHTSAEILNTALQLEANTIEAITFKSMSSELEPMEKVLRKLENDSANHKKMIEEAIEKSSGLIQRIKAQFSK